MEEKIDAPEKKKDQTFRVSFYIAEIDLADLIDFFQSLSKKCGQHSR